MRKDGAGRLMCPDDFGPSATEQDRLRARSEKERLPPKPAVDAYVRHAPTPLSILGHPDDGGIAHTWVKPNSLQDLQFIDDRVTRMHERVSDHDFIRISLPQLRPFWSPDAFDGVPGIGSGVGDTWNLTTDATTFTTLPAGGRQYAWLVMKVIAFTSVSTSTALTMGGSTGGINVQTTDVFLAGMTCTDGSESINGPAVDTNAHLFELCPLTTSAGRFVVDGTGYDGVRTGAYTNSAASITLCSTNNSAALWVGEFVLASETPTASQRSQMRDYFATEFTELDIA
jgi:hypothetical protein